MTVSVTKKNIFSVVSWLYEILFALKVHLSLVIKLKSMPFHFVDTIQYSLANQCLFRDNAKWKYCWWTSIWYGLLKPTWSILQRFNRIIDRMAGIRGWFAPLKCCYHITLLNSYSYTVGQNFGKKLKLYIPGHRTLTVSYMHVACTCTFHGKKIGEKYLSPDLMKLALIKSLKRKETQNIYFSIKIQRSSSRIIWK
jgi:hypothetical protein